MVQEKKNCFVIMPISDPTGYENGHFSRVYSHIIRPACELAGVNTVRADDVKNINYIILDILKRTIESEIAICDLSSRNPNVLYELGIRQAFNLPVVLIKDKATPRIFDIQGFRTVEYDESLRIDTVQDNVKYLVAALKNTMEQKKDDINSLVQLLSVKPAIISQDTQISSESVLILNELKNITSRVSIIEKHLSKSGKSRTERNIIREPKRFELPNGTPVSIGDELYNGHGGDRVGNFLQITNAGVVVEVEKNHALVIPPDDELYNRLSSIPF